MRVYFVRHALSRSNELGTFESVDSEVELSEKGHVQAAAVGKRFRHIPIEIIISSSYRRAQQTAEQIRINTHNDVLTTPLLGERKHPSMFAGRHMDDAGLLEVRKKLLENAQDQEWRHSDEENYWDIIARARRAIEFIEARPEQSLAVVTHSAFLKAILTVMIFGDDSKPLHYESVYHCLLPKNTGITVCEYKSVPGTIRRHPQWRIMTFNDYAHLGE